MATMAPGLWLTTTTTTTTSRSITAAAGVARIRATFGGGQVQEIDLPFIDSLWLIARPKVFPVNWVVNKITDVELEVAGYVGVDGKTMAKRKFEGFLYKDYSVQGIREDDGIGPIVFSSDIDSQARVEPFHHPVGGVGPQLPETRLQEAS